jgi:MOSC domain-containing protein YiiM
MGRGRIVAIHIHGKGGEMPHAIPEARLVVGKGIEGDVHFLAAKNPDGGGEELTLVESEAIEAAKREYGIDVTAAATRRNIETRDVPLNHLVGRDFRVGTAVCRGVKLCEPCGHLEKMTVTGIRKALIHRGGLRARILRDGVARPGDSVEPLD